MALASSSGLPKRLSAFLRAARRLASSSVFAFSSACSPCAFLSHRLVATQPGHTALTWMPSSPHSVESDLVRFRSALLVMPLPNM